MAKSVFWKFGGKKRFCTSNDVDGHVNLHTFCEQVLELVNIFITFCSATLLNTVALL